MSESPTEQRPRRSINRALPLALALGALTLVAAACGGSPTASVANLGSSKTTTTTTAPSSDAAGSSQKGGGSSQGGSQQSSLGMGGITVQFAQCMRSHGVANFPDPNSEGQVTMSGVNPQSSSFGAAQRACAKYSPGGGKPPSAAQQQRAVAQALRFSECMRSHGITDFPDPQVSSSGGHVGIRISIKAGQGSDLDPNSAQFQAAQTACRSLRPVGAKAPGGSTSSAG